MNRKRPVEEVVAEMTSQLLYLQAQIDDIHATQGQFQMALEHLLGILPEEEREKVIRLFSIYSDKLPHQK